ncbi:hypothetical protein TNCV_5087341 [Trichonephila clavipes]|nr:hypothetical protein TNCV_5087331 [Trichonephila clavipes]GFU39500.1 hypothetical protein TNCV_5087341 [Trichonephila clavipes]
MSPKATDLDKTGLEDHGIEQKSKVHRQYNTFCIHAQHSTDRGKLGIDSGIVSRSSQTKNGIPDLFLKRNQQKVVLSVLERARERDCVQQDECRGRRSVDFRTSTQSREGIAEENQTQQCV